MATADVRTFWSAFVRVLLVCVAALGCATRSRTRVTATVGTAGTGTPTQAATPTATSADSNVSGTTTVYGTTSSGTVAAARSPLHREAARTVPGRRCAYTLPPRRARRGRTLPPTMKQRIRAEAHGASPAARSVLTADTAADAAALGPTGVPVAVAPTVGRTDVRATAPARLAHIPAPRRRAHAASCG
ncbi:DUF6344 domain-containing protein [Streptomyces sp.]|uniref:DUF6344 domain-containing protein n=1 Tax=Streptomyces sp. TaxID=1931 RepID=UPI002F40ED9F